MDTTNEVKLHGLYIGFHLRHVWSTGLNHDRPRRGGIHRFCGYINNKPDCRVFYVQAHIAFASNSTVRGAIVRLMPYAKHSINPMDRDRLRQRQSCLEPPTAIYYTTDYNTSNRFDLKACSVNNVHLHNSLIPLRLLWVHHLSHLLFPDHVRDPPHQRSRGLAGRRTKPAAIPYAR
jgi:hypothetical protein